MQTVRRTQPLMGERAVQQRRIENKTNFLKRHQLGKLNNLLKRDVLKRGSLLLFCTLAIAGIKQRHAIFHDANDARMAASNGHRSRFVEGINRCAGV